MRMAQNQQQQQHAGNDTLGIDSAANRQQNEGTRPAAPEAPTDASNGAAAAEPTGIMARIRTDFLNCQKLFYPLALSPVYTKTTPYSAIPSTETTGIVTLCIVGEVGRQAYNSPENAIISESPFQGRPPYSMGTHVLANVIVLGSNAQFLRKTGGTSAWNRYDSFFWLKAGEVGLMLLCMAYIWYHNSRIPKKQSN